MAIDLNDPRIRAHLGTVGERSIGAQRRDAIKAGIPPPPRPERLTGAEGMEFANLVASHGPGDLRRTGATTLNLGLSGNTQAERYGAGALGGGVGQNREFGAYSHGMGSAHREGLEQMLRRNPEMASKVGYQGQPLTVQDFRDLTLSGMRRQIEGADGNQPQGPGFSTEGWAQAPPPGQPPTSPIAGSMADFMPGPSQPPMGTAQPGGFSMGGGQSMGPAQPGGFSQQPQMPMGGPPGPGGFGAFHNPLAGVVSGQYLGGNPELRNRIGAEQQDLIQQYQRVVSPSISRAAEAAGRYGSDAYQMAQGEAAGGLTRALGDIGSSMQFQDYNARMGDLMQGLGMGTSRDIAAMQEQGQQQSQASNEQLQRDMQMQNLQFQAQQAMQQGDMQTMQMMLDAAAQMGAQQGNVLGNLPGIDQMGGMGALGQLLSQSTGLDNAAIQAILQGQQQQNQLKLGQGQLNLGQSQLGLDQQQQQYLQQLAAMGFMNQNPWDMLGNYQQIIGNAAGPYGTSSSTGNTTAPYQWPSPWEAAIQGGLGAARLFSGGMGGGGGDTL